MFCHQDRDGEGSTKPCCIFLLDFPAPVLGRWDPVTVPSDSIQAELQLATTRPGLKPPHAQPSPASSFPDSQPEGEETRISEEPARG